MLNFFVVYEKCIIIIIFGLGHSAPFSIEFFYSYNNN